MTSRSSGPRRQEGMEQERKRQSATAAAAGAAVLVVECVAGSSKAEEWDGGGSIVQERDVVEAVPVRVGSWTASLRAFFKGGGAARGPALCADTSVEVRGSRRLYVLRSLHDHNNVLGFGDHLESDSLSLQGPTLRSPTRSLTSQRIDSSSQ